MIKVFLVEDEIIIRNGIKNSINWEMHGYDFVGEASDGELALPMILEKKPDILITDIKMPFMDGLELSEQVKKVLPATKIMILSGYNEFDYAKMAIKIGVTDYLLKPISSEKLLDAVNKVAEEIRKEQSEKEQMNQYAREMQENKESEKFQFFNQVFAGSMPFGECLEQGKQLGIEISAEGYCVILFKIIMIDHPMDYNEDIVSATEDIENLSEQTEKLLWFRRGVEGWGFIAQGAVGEELTARAQTFREDLEKVLEKYKNLEYFGGIGSQVGRFSEIKRSYNDANRAFAERFFITCIQFVPYCLSVNSIFIDIVYPLIFECPFIFQDQFIHKGRHPFHHDNKTIPTFIHILYILAAEISPVQNESNLLITISGCFIQHELKLGDIIQTSWIFFIK